MSITISVRRKLGFLMSLLVFILVPISSTLASPLDLLIERESIAPLLEEKQKIKMSTRAFRALRQDAQKTPTGRKTLIYLDQIIKQHPHFLMAWTNKKGQGAVAEYHENGEILFDAYKILSLEKNKTGDYTSQPNPFPHSTSGFLVHEATHAIAYDLAQKGLLKDHDSHTKINEALAYHQQLRHIKELEKQNLIYKEAYKISPWDSKVIATTQDLKILGIDFNTPKEKALDIIQEAFLDATSPREMNHYTSLENLFLFIDQSDEKEELWTLSPENADRSFATLKILRALETDLMNQDQNLSETFYYFKNRIPLYSPLPNFSSPKTKGLDFIKDYERSLDAGIKNL